jgi:hypothetical protein
MVEIAVKRICGDPVGLSPSDVPSAQNTRQKISSGLYSPFLNGDGGTSRLDLLLVLIGTNRIVERV